MKLKYRVGLAVIVSLIIGAGAFLTTTRAGGLAGVQWNQIGPAPLQIDQNQNYQGVGPDSGQIVDIAIDPRNTDDQVIFVATNDGGIWKTTDGGSTWATTTDFLDSLSMGAVTLDAANKSIVYAGTGNDFNNGFVKAIGVYISTDDGGSWSLTAGSSSLTGRNIIRMVSPAANTLVVATSQGLFRSTNGGGNFTQVVPTGVASGSYISDLHLDTGDPSIVYAAVYGVGIFASTDGGATFPTNLWTNANGAPTAGVKFISFAQGTQPNNAVFWASVQTASYGMYRSMDFGGTWHNIPGADGPAAADGGCQCGYDQTIGSDPNNGNILYIGFQQLYKSTNALDTTASNVSFSNVTANQVHWDHHAIAFGQQPASPTAVFVGEDGGIAMTTNGGSNWTNINGSAGGTNALATNLFRGIGIGVGSSTNRQYTYGGTQDTGTIEFTPSFTAQTWHLGIDGDGGTVAVDPCDPTHAIGQDDACFIETTNAGGNWSEPSVFANYAGLLGFTSFQTVAFDPSCDNTVYVGVETQTTPPQSNCFNDQLSTHDLYQSTNNGGSYTKIHSFANPITDIATVKIDPNTIWIGFNDGTLQFTANAQSGVSSTWQAPATQPASIGGQPVTGIAIDPTNTDVVVVVYPGFSGLDPNVSPTKHVFMTSDGGATWTDISGVTNGGASNLPDLPLHSVVIDPSTNPHTIVVASDAGVMQTADLGNTWQVLGVGMPTVEVTSLALDSSTNPPLLRAGTYGRSVFELGPATTGLLAVNANLNFAQICKGTNSTQIVTLYNVGAADLHVSSFARVSGSADFTIISGPSTPVTISPDSSVAFTIQFNPTGSGTESAVFQINSDDPFTPEKQLTAFGGVATPAIATLIASSGNFGDTCLGSFTDLNLTISNSGQCALQVTGINSPDPEYLTATAVSYPLTIAAGGSIIVPLRFQPTTLGGPKPALINITSNDPVNPLSYVNVTGNAPSGTIAVTGSPQFGDVCAQSNPTHTLSINNVGKCDLNVTSASVDCSDFALVNNPFPAAVSPDSHVDETVKWTPTSGGAKSCNLVLNTDDPSNPVVNVPLTGDTPAVNLSVPATGLTFAPTVVQNSANCQATLGAPVTNAGKCPVQVNSVALSGTNADQFAVTGLSALPSTVASGGQLGSGDMEAIFKPNLPLTRTDTANIDVTYVSDPITDATNVVSIPLCGEATRRGFRVLVTLGGVPVAKVKRFKLWAIAGKGREARWLRLFHKKNLPLQTVTGAGPCPTFQYHVELGTVANPVQLGPGTYLLRVMIKVGKKRKRKKVRFTIGACDFDQQLNVAF